MPKERHSLRAEVEKRAHRNHRATCEPGVDISRFQPFHNLGNRHGNRLGDRPSPPPPLPSPTTITAPFPCRPAVDRQTQSLHLSSPVLPGCNTRTHARPTRTYGKRTSRDERRRGGRGRRPARRRQLGCQVRRRPAGEGAAEEGVDEGDGVVGEERVRGAVQQLRRAAPARPAGSLPPPPLPPHHPTRIHLSTGRPKYTISAGRVGEHRQKTGRVQARFPRSGRVRWTPSGLAAGLEEVGEGHPRPIEYSARMLEYPPRSLPPQIPERT